MPKEPGENPREENVEQNNVPPTTSGAMEKKKSRGPEQILQELLGKSTLSDEEKLRAVNLIRDTYRKSMPEVAKAADDEIERMNKQKSERLEMERISQIRKEKPEGKMQTVEASTEDKEIEKLPPVLLLYRDNDLFEKKVPGIASTLRGVGRTVEIQKFPREVDVKEIEEWIKKNFGDIQDRVIFSDETCGNYISPIISGKVQGKIDASGKKFEFDWQKTQEVNKLSKVEGGKHKLGHLDSIYNNTLKTLFLKEKADTDEDITEELSLEETGEVFTAIVKKILENPDQKPKKVGLFLSNLWDHEPFHELLVKKARKDWGFKENENVPVDLLNSSIAGKELNEKIVGLLKQWLIQAGIPEGSIELSGMYGSQHTSRMTTEQEKQQREALMKFDEEGNWVLVDRHVKSFVVPRYGEENEFKHAIELKLPLYNLFQDVKEKGLVDISDEELDNAVKEFLVRSFGPKESNKESSVEESLAPEKQEKVGEETNIWESMTNEEVVEYLTTRHDSFKKIKKELKKWYDDDGYKEVEEQGKLKDKSYLQKYFPEVYELELELEKLRSELSEALENFKAIKRLPTKFKKVKV